MQEATLTSGVELGPTGVRLETVAFVGKRLSRVLCVLDARGG